MHLGYVCSCDIGKRIAGTCVHVSTVLYYLGRLKDNPNGLIFNRADYLNKIFINTKANQKPNEPAYVKNTRRKYIHEAVSSAESCKDTSYEYISEAESEATEETIQSIKSQFTQKPLIKARVPKKIVGSKKKKNKRSKKEFTDSEDEFSSAKETTSEIESSDVSINEDNNSNQKNNKTRRLRKRKINNKSNKNKNPKLDSSYNNYDLLDSEKNDLHENILNNDSIEFTEYPDKNTAFEEEKSFEFYRQKFNLKSFDIKLKKLKEDDFENLMYKAKIQEKKDDTKFEEKDMIQNAPSWSAVINYDNDIFKLIDTCPLDYGLFGLWISSKLNEKFLSSLKETSKTKDIIDTVKYVNENWDLARENWVTKILNENQVRKIENPKQNENQISIHGSTEAIFFDHLLDFQKYSLKQKCSMNCRLNNTDMPEDLFIEKNYYSVVLKKDISGLLNIKGFTRNYDNFCHECNSEIYEKIHFDNTPNFLCMSYLNNFDISLSDIKNDEKLIVEINKVKFKFLFGIHHSLRGTGHFTALFYLFNKYFQVDDMGRKKVKEINSKSNKNLFDKKLNSAYYYRMDLDEAVSTSNKHEPSPSRPSSASKPSSASVSSSAFKLSANSEPSSAFKLSAASEPSSASKTLLSSKITRRREILLKPDSDDEDDKEDGIYTSENKRIFSEISEWKKSLKKELDDKINKEFREQVMQMKENNVSFDPKKLKETISSQIYEKWAFEKASADPELARKAGYDLKRMIHK